MPDLMTLRDQMVARQLRARGIRDQRVLDAMAAVPREEFVPPELVAHAYDDAPLPIEERQTISQPYIVALMIEALELEPGDRILEVGAGSGYTAAVLARICQEVFAVERHRILVEGARRRFVDLGVASVKVRHGDGTLGWPEHAPYDAILVSAGGPEVPRSLVDQLAPGGRLVIPVGESPRQQRLLRLRRVEGHPELQREDLGEVAFVPLVGREGWPERESPAPREKLSRTQAEISSLMADGADRLEGVDEGDLGPLLERMANSRVVLLGESTHGTSEFYRLRSRITEELVAHRGFTIIALEADWPDAAALDRRVRGLPERSDAPRRAPFSRFPTWMWANRDLLELLGWLEDRNQGLPLHRQAGIYGLDLYSLYESIDAVLGYLQDVDPQVAKLARQRYACLEPWAGDAAAYGADAVSGGDRECEAEAIAILQELLARRLEYLGHDGPRYLDAVQNARLVANAERYYRTLYQGSRAAWNLRDQHMFDTLMQVMDAAGPDSRAVVWAHNSHLGDATATEMGGNGEINLGQLVRQRFAERAYLVGFGTDHGTVTAARDWGHGPEVMELAPGLPGSCEHLCHGTGLPLFTLPLAKVSAGLKDPLMAPRLQRAVGVVYRPHAERASHYFHAVLPKQFDEWVWVDETTALAPLERAQGKEEAETFPFGV